MTEADATSTELRPCPFCGGANVDPTGWSSKFSMGPACDDCGAAAGSSHGGLDENIATWNHREPDPSYAAEMHRAANARADGYLDLLRECRDSILWWEKQHSCCAGQDDKLLAAIDAALAKVELNNFNEEKGDASK